jgi:hypothetical protein
MMASNNHSQTTAEKIRHEQLQWQAYRTQHDIKYIDECVDSRQPNEQSELILIAAALLKRQTS